MGLNFTEREKMWRFVALIWWIQVEWILQNKTWKTCLIRVFMVNNFIAIENDYWLSSEIVTVFVFHQFL